MPWGLRRFQEAGQLHFLTFSCYKRRPNFANAPSRSTFETSLEQVRQRYGLCVYCYVVMPEHIHMLVNEPEQGPLSRVMQSLKQSVARTLALRAADPFWQARYYDFNVWSEHKFVEKREFSAGLRRGAIVQCRKKVSARLRNSFSMGHRVTAATDVLDSLGFRARRADVGGFITISV